MTIASEITKLNTNLGAAYTAVDSKGGTLPQAQNMDNLATAISSIPSGGSAPVITSLSITPTTSAQTITAPSGTDGYSPVNVTAVTAAIDSNITAGNIKSGVTILGVTGNYEGSGGGGIGIPREVKNGVYQMPTENFNIVLSDEVDTLDYYVFYYAFYQCSSLVNFNLNNVTTIRAFSISHACYNCPNLINANLSNVITVNDNGMPYAFANCPLLSTVNVSNIKTIGQYGAQYAFSETALVNVDFQSLDSLAYGAFINSFRGCQSIENIYFKSLNTGSFGSYKNQFNSMLAITGTTVTHTLHFPSNMQSKISGLSGYPNFGGTSGYVVCAFDLPATS